LFGETGLAGVNGMNFGKNEPILTPAANFSALSIVRDVVQRRIAPGARCVDATAGRGQDTVFLCKLTGENGRVWAFDIQQEAIDSTTALLAKHNLSATVIPACHSRMAQYLPADGVDCVLFNFGWLPGSDHTVMTQPDTSIAAVRSAMELLRPGGMISLCIYYGRESGFAERDALLGFFPLIDPDRFTVIAAQFFNRPNNPPFPVFIFRNDGP
jgi:Predicted S-adenosylmethionine-dependent methyltransferase involved in cell envelope biogenesis